MTEDQIILIILIVATGLYIIYDYFTKRKVRKITKVYSISTEEFFEILKRSDTPEELMKRLEKAKKENKSKE